MIGYPFIFLRSRGCSVLQSSFPECLGSLLACFHPFRPFPFRTLRGSFIRVAFLRVDTKQSSLSCTLTPPQRFSSSGAASDGVGSGRREPPSKCTSLELRALQHLKVQSPFLVTLGFPMASVSVYLRSQKSHPQGLATLSAVSAFLNPWEPLSVPDTLGLRSSELFSI